MLSIYGSAGRILGGTPVQWRVFYSLALDIHGMITLDAFEPIKCMEHVYKAWAVLITRTLAGKAKIGGARASVSQATDRASRTRKWFKAA